MTETTKTDPEAVDFTFELSDREISFDLDEELYALDAVYGAAYLFIDRAYVYLARPADKKVRIRLRTKSKTATPDELEELAGEFANELLNSQLRLRIGRATATLREQYMAKAFFGEQQSSTISELLAELDAEELAEDPLEVAVPWDKKDDAAVEEGKQDG
ncbi:MAG: His-Xaa-Ser system protein HxsD [Myxococcales bacterium]|nr:His-Xaa-Ser system protein HxsD [Myxococcales bacterium]MCB9578372.1 His-Xaa-Ser system protein HxsD [Polyangiaceae bacterium]